MMLHKHPHILFCKNIIKASCGCLFDIDFKFTIDKFEGDLKGQPTV